ncbi:hypothetical protein H0178_34050 [Cytobacillus firmus]|uniref:hypothetical protein n=1 Tax=Paenibacillus lautus TaxID=1401 RepID=UPI00384AC86F|nr:hypothetical protein [Cytobacillus firmus]
MEQSQEGKKDDLRKTEVIFFSFNSETDSFRLDLVNGSAAFAYMYLEQGKPPVWNKTGG